MTTVSKAPPAARRPVLGRPWPPPILALALALLAIGACRGGRGEAGASGAPEEATPAAPPPSPAHRPGTATTALERLTITDPAQLEGRELATLRHLGIALSPDDVEVRLAAGHRSPRPSSPTDDPPEQVEDPCAGLDLLEIAERAPALESLRISGCQAQLHAGLAGFAPSLRALELVDITLDPVIAGRITQLEQLESLTLTRVRADESPPSAVLGRRLGIRALTLRELERDSVLGDLLGDLPELRSVQLEGSWAGYRAMLSLSHARRVEELTLVDTSVNNFALHQIKPLEHLREVRWSGNNINDLSPIYLKDLPVESFSCTCPRLSDQGLKQLRHVGGLRRIDLPQSRISGATLGSLAELEQLEELRIADRDLGPEGLASLAEIPGLRVLALGGTSLEDPGAEKLEGLVGLRVLEFKYDNVGDAAVARIGALTELEELDLGGTQVSDRALEHLAGLEQLRVLKLHHTRITNRGLAHLSGLSRLEILELDHTDLVDEAVAHLAPLTKLRELRLDATLITDAAIDHLLSLPRLERLNLADTAVTPAAAARLSALPELRAVHLGGVP